MIPCKKVELITRPKDFEGIFLEINLRKTKWLLLGAYNSSQHTIVPFLNHISKTLDKCLPNYDNFILLGDFNSPVNTPHMSDFCLQYDLSNLIKEPTCYKNPVNPSSIDVILTNRESSFQSSIALEVGISDHHKMVITVLKVYIKKKKLLLSHIGHTNILTWIISRKI